jgi:type 1 glutamine amidotransferase
MKPTLIALLVALSFTLPAPAATPDGKKKLVLIAGKPSHPPRMHEFRAGALLIRKCLANVPGLLVEVHDNGWVKDEKTFDDADAIVIYADGGGGHPAVQGDHLAKIDALVKKGVGFAAMHYGVEVLKDKGGPEFKQWIGGHYEHMFSCNPIWEPKFESFPEHPITRGVKPFSTKDEWYFNMRFADGFSAEKPAEAAGTKFWPILVAKPSDAVRKGPYVYPSGPYPHIVEASGRAEAMMWAVERPDGGRGFGFTGGHFHDNWANGDVRRAALNALVWVAKAEVPKEGVASTVTKEELDLNLDPKGKK